MFFHLRVNKGSWSKLSFNPSLKTVTCTVHSVDLFPKYRAIFPEENCTFWAKAASEIRMKETNKTFYNYLLILFWFDIWYTYSQSLEKRSNSWLWLYIYTKNPSLCTYQLCECFSRDGLYANLIKLFFDIFFVSSSFALVVIIGILKIKIIVETPSRLCFKISSYILALNHANYSKNIFTNFLRFII